MKKLFYSILILGICFFAFDFNAKAASEMYKCDYTFTVGQFKANYYITIYDDYSITEQRLLNNLSLNGEVIYYYNGKGHEQLKKEIQEKKNLSCPTFSTCVENDQYKLQSGTSTGEGCIVGTVTKREVNVKEDDKLTDVCSRTQRLRNANANETTGVTVTIYYMTKSDGSKWWSIGNKNNPVEVTSSIFLNGRKYTNNNAVIDQVYSTKDCKNNLYFECANGTIENIIIKNTKPSDTMNCSYSSNVSDPNNEKNDDGKEKTTTTTTTKTVVTKKTTNSKGSCMLGKDVTENIIQIWKIIRIVVPLLAIGLTIFEFIKALTKGDIMDESKKLQKRFVKRIILIAVLLTLVPIMNSVLPLILGEEYCSLTEATSNGVEGEEEGFNGDENGGSGDQNGKKPASDGNKSCSDYTGKDSCESNGCSWVTGSNSYESACKEKTVTPTTKTSSVSCNTLSNSECVKYSNCYVKENSCHFKPGSSCSIFGQKNCNSVSGCRVGNNGQCTGTVS